jgi:hypothetical protein
MLDDILDDVEDLLDPTTPEGVVFIAGSGFLDDERDDDADGDPCTCWCGCRRRAPWAEDECRRCRDGRHRDDE